jgi:hypothetical protein
VKIPVPLIPTFERLKQEDQEFKTNIGYIVSSRLAWKTLQDPVFKKK